MRIQKGQKVYTDFGAFDLGFKINSTSLDRVYVSLIIWSENFNSDRIMENDVFWDVTPSGSSKNRRFGGT
jgi:hypothetical protein